jgi:serine/threonine protein kinase/Flp pilus assembly protein TadD
MRGQGEATTVRPDSTGSGSGESRSPEDLVAELAEAFLERHRRGERPAVEEYAAAHPELAGEIRRVLRAVLMVEDLKPAASDPAGGLAAASATAPERLGDYRILREVGRGGMGVVYEAEQESLGRRVALKVLAAQGLRNPTQLLRFHREARAAARLHHTNIVPVFGVGEAEGQHYYVMQFIPGLGLDAVLDELKRLRSPWPQGEASAPPAASGTPSAADVARSLMTGRFAPALAVESPDPTPTPGLTPQPAPPAPPSSLVLPGQARGSSATDSAGRYARSVALIGVQVAEALDYAHRQGTLHRDIKPSNLLLDGQGTVWVADFGLAKAADSNDLTHTGDIVGTVRYMAPERFEGHCDARSDVYALGLTLYELLARRPAFEKAGRAELIHQVTHEEPPRLRSLDPTVPRDLETVVHKAIEREPARRYSEAEALAADLRRFVEGRPIRARRISPLEHAWRWCRLNPAWAALATAIVALIGLAVGGGLWVQQQRVQRRAEAVLRAGRARDVVEALIGQAERLRQQGLWSEARTVLAQAERQLNDSGGHGLPERLQRAQADLELAARLEHNAIGRTDFPRRESQYPAVAADYAAAFRGAGLAAADEETDAESVAARIHGSAIREQLVAALDDWSLVTVDARLRARLLLIAQRADPDPGWRDRVRDPAVRGDRRALERLAAEVREVSGAEQPPQLLMTLAGLLKEVGGDPVPLLRTVQRRRPGDFWLNLALGRMLLESRPAESAAFRRAALVLRPGDSALTFDLGWALCMAHEPGEALSVFRRSIELDPKGSAAHYGRGLALLDLGRPGEALAAFRRSLELDPKGSPAHFGLGRALVYLGRPGEALAAFRRSLELDPKGAPAHYGLGKALLDLGKPEEAAAAFRRSIELGPKESGAHYGLGKALLDLGKPEEAAAAFRRSLELDPMGTLAHCRLGQALLELGKLEAAAAAFRRSLELDPKSALAHYGLGKALLGLDRPGEALAAFRRSLELDPDEPDAWNQAATLWARTGNRAGYRDHCRRMLDRFGPTTDPIIAERTAKACLLLPLGGPEQEGACDLADRAVAMAQGHWVEPWAEATRGLAAYRRGQFADAVAWADRCLTRGPGDWNRELPAHLVQAMALARLGRRGEASAALARASDLYRTKVANPGGRAPGGDWNDQVICEVLRREAAADFLDRDFPADPFAR